MVLLTGVMVDGKPYLRAGAEFWRDDVAGLLLDGLVSKGVLFEDGGVVWEADKCGQRPILIGDNGEVLFAQENGYARLVDCETIAGNLGL